MLDQANATFALFSIDQIPLWLKVSYTLFIFLLVPVYWLQYGPTNLLWFSDIALLTTVVALWLESSLLASMMALSVTLLEFAWILDFFTRLIVGASVTGLSSYMFDPKISLPIRALSLFHIALPGLLLWLLYRLGYDSRALIAQTLVAWIVLPLSYFLSGPSENVNWVYGFGDERQRWMPATPYLGLLMVLSPLLLYLPTHFLFKGIFSYPQR